MADKPAIIHTSTDEVINFIGAVERNFPDGELKERMGDVLYRMNQALMYGKEVVFTSAREESN